MARLLPLVALHDQALAAKGPECGTYIYQEDAQLDFDRTVEEYPTLADMWAESLDPDGNGQACDALPPRPTELDNAQRIVGGQFEPFKGGGYVVSGLGYSITFFLHLAGVQYTDDCPQVDDTFLTSLVVPPDKVATTFYLLSTSGDVLPPDEGGGKKGSVGLAWFVAGDPSSPVLANEWLLQAGLAKIEEATVPPEYADRLQAAEDAARSAGIGVWGSCDFSNTAIGADTTTAYAHLLRKSGEGDQIVRFTIETEGTYQLTVDAMGGAVVFVAADIYATDGTWFPEFSIISSDSGAFTSASYLYPGNYYVQVKSVGGWRLTIDAL